MTTTPMVQHDERTIAVENASYRWAYNFLAIALLIDIAYRGVVRHEAAWDLMALVVVAGVGCSIYHSKLKILGPGWGKKVALIGCVTAVIAAAVGYLMS